MYFSDKSFAFDPMFNRSQCVRSLTVITLVLIAVRILRLEGWAIGNEPRYMIYNHSGVCAIN